MLNIIFLLTLSALVSHVSGHGHIIEPDCKASNDFVTTLLDTSVFPGYKAYSNGASTPVRNAEMFKEQFKKTNKYKNIRQIIDAKVSGCGTSSMEKKSYDGLNAIKVQNSGNTNEGLTPSHNGPCEVWIDDKMVFQHFDCASEFQSSPAVIPVDYSSCGASCTLRFYWLALQEAQIQVYKNCVPLTGSGKGNKNSTASPKPKSSSPTPTVVRNTPAPGKKSTSSKKKDGKGKFTSGSEDKENEKNGKEKNGKSTPTPTKSIDVKKTHENKDGDARNKELDERNKELDRKNKELDRKNKELDRKNRERANRNNKQSAPTSESVKNASKCTPKRR